MINEKSVFKKYPLWFEIVLGILFGVLNSTFSTFFGNIQSPIFMDTIFAVTASFIGWWSGILSVITFAVLSFIKSDAGLKIIGVLFVLCVLAMVFIIRLTFYKKDKVSFLSLIYIYLLFVFFVSLIGAVISTYAFNKFHYPDYYSVKYITMMFVHQQIPLIFSSFLSRIPVNAVDKLIAVFAGYGLYILIEKMARKANLVSE